MFTKIYMKNFRSFQEIEFDLSAPNNAAKHMALVYGENGSGKTNLMMAFTFLKATVESYALSASPGESFLARLKGECKQMLTTQEGFQRALMNNDLAVKYASVLSRAAQWELSLTTTAKKHRMIDGNGDMVVRYEFILKGKKGFYELCFDGRNNLKRETLHYLIKKRTGLLFEIIKDKNDHIRKSFSDSFFIKSNYKVECLELIDKLWGKYTFLALLLESIFKLNETFVRASLSESFLDLLLYFLKTTVLCRQGRSEIGYQNFSSPNEMLGRLEQGRVNRDDKKTLQIFEEALNDFFTRLYADVKRVYYDTKVEGTEIAYTLYFEKMVHGELRHIPFSEESTGTKKLLDIFPALYECARGNTVIIDEMDSGVHDLLMAHIINELQDSLKGQVIATTHNTMLLEHIKDTSAYILDVDRNGVRTIDTIKNIAGRTQNKHNNRVRYVNGLFGGTPMSAYLDFTGIVNYAQGLLEASSQDESTQSEEGTQ